MAARGGFAVPGITMAVFLFSLQLPLFEERIHLLQYGLVGFLWTNAFFYYQKPNSLLLPIIGGCFAGLATACLDEAIQAILPYRVGDLRDVGFDFIGCVAGVATRFLYRGKMIQETRAIAPPKSV